MGGARYEAAFRTNLSMLSIAIATGVVTACASPRASTAERENKSPKPAAATASAASTRSAPGPGAPNARPQATPVAQESRPPVLAPSTRGAEVEPARLERLVRRNTDLAVSLPESLLAARIAAWKTLPVGERIALWAQLFAARRDNTYCFGPKPGGYVGDSLLVQDHKFDCVSFFYRCTELARAQSPRDAVLLALTTRFANGTAAAVVRPTGAVDYDDPAHLDYSEDFAATGLWGRDVTHDVGVDTPDAVGTSRYPAGTRSYIPSDRIRLDRLRDGDLLFFVLNEANDKARKLRQDYGLLIGHQAIVHVEHGTVYQIHAAQSDLPGEYTGNRVVQVPLATYLRRTEKFKGIMVSRIESEETPKLLN